MKLSVLLPVVASKHKEFEGYKAEETIDDHDTALSYVLVHYPDVLPSYVGLSPGQQQIIKFVHHKMAFNMGWLVQGEAPPGQLFSAFRNVIQNGNANSDDIAFYFLHWFADLAGAEPSPKEGLEKFVLKFPKRVLDQFIQSFPVLRGLSQNTETQVLEDYLIGRWSRHDPHLGALPEGPGALAKMRLIVMAQGDSQEVLRCFDNMRQADREVLEREMSMTGCKKQTFVREINPDAASKGPALLVYYGPALMQKCGKKDPSVTLRILAGVYRTARDLFPLKAEHVGTTATVRIDALKDSKKTNKDT
jgi:hypothetical protein